MNKQILIVIFAALSLLLIGCDSENWKQRAETLAKENAVLEKKIVELEQQIDELVNGPERILAQARQALDDKRWNQAILMVDKLKELHPQAPELADGEDIVVLAQKGLESEAKRQEQEIKEKEKRQQAALSGLKKQYDKVQEISWYYPTSDTYSKSTIYLYIGKKETGKGWLRFVVRYKGDWWIFFNYLEIKIDDRPSFKLFPVNEAIHDNSGGTVWEWIDEKVTDGLIITIEDIIKSQETIIRFNGDDKIRDFTVTNQMKKDLRKVLDAFEALNSL